MLSAHFLSRSFFVGMTWKFECNKVVTFTNFKFKRNKKPNLASSSAELNNEFFITTMQEELLAVLALGSARRPSPIANSHGDTAGRANKLFAQGKVAELRLELNSGGKKDKNNSAKKIALKKIVANMTMSNNDMVALFPDVVSCMQIPSLEIKKM